MLSSATYTIYVHTNDNMHYYVLMIQLVFTMKLYTWLGCNFQKLLLIIPSYIIMTGSKERKWYSDML